MKYRLTLHKHHFPHTILFLFTLFVLAKRMVIETKVNVNVFSDSNDKDFSGSVSKSTFSKISILDRNYQRNKLFRCLKVEHIDGLIIDKRARIV